MKDKYRNASDHIRHFSPKLEALYMYIDRKTNEKVVMHSIHTMEYYQALKKNCCY